MATTSVNGLDLYYEELTTATSKAPLLMIMGLTFSLLDWGDDLPKALSNNYRVIMFDNRASGRTKASSPLAPFTVSNLADDAAGLLAQLKISRAHVFGISMGGMIAQELAVKHSGLVHKLVLGCTACSSAILSPGALGATTGSGSGDPPAWALLFSKDFIEKNRTNLAPFWKRAEPFHSQGVEKDLQMGAVMTHDTCSRLSKIGSETLILTGDSDPVIHPSNSDKLKEIPGARLVTDPFKGAFHGFPYSHWKETLAELTGFLK